jgi:acetyl-CoA/propionyl-CoA carboxylase biotin carboxyl carrier protein
MAGLILSIAVKVGEPVSKGVPIAMIEAMKMRRQVLSPLGGVIKEIRAKEGAIVAPEDVLVVVS